MNNIFDPTLRKFLLQAFTSDLKTSSFPKSWEDFNMKVSFGMGAPARIPWIAFTTEEMQVSKGFYPVYLFYKKNNILILSFGISETNEFEQTWPKEVLDDALTITDYFDQKVARYGDSLVYKAYRIKLNNGNVLFFDPEKDIEIGEAEIESDLTIMLQKYRECFDIVEKTHTQGEIGVGLFYMEKQLEDFLIQNWDKTTLGEKYHLIYDHGDLVSQQFRTDIGRIDILVKDKDDKHIVIELKKDQSSDDTIGQVTRYMGWVKDYYKDDYVKGIVIAGTFDKKLENAIKVIPNIEVLTYSIDFKLKEFKEENK